MALSGSSVESEIAIAESAAAVVELGTRAVVGSASSAAACALVAALLDEVEVVELGNSLTAETFGVLSL